MTALPKLLPLDSLTFATRQYLDDLKASDFAGDIEVAYASRLAVATDNSIYQQLPQAVLHPKNISDLQLLASISANKPDITFSARGGGTGTNGQSLTPGIVVDTSRYMNQILELNIEQQWVSVQSGVVKDALNDYLRPHGYFFSPDLSTSNRATMGGMISTDASGQGSLVYGKTSDHLLSLEAVLANGDLLSTKAKSISDAEKLAQQDNAVGHIYKQIIASCVGKRSEILAKFPRLNRFLTGYDLEHAYDEDNNSIDAGRLIAGAEGSLAFIAEAKLNITKIPTYSTLVNIKYDNFESALRHAPSMIEANATSVETVDSKVLNLARTDIIWHSVSALIEDVPNKIMDGLNMVEYNSEDKHDIARKIAILQERLDDEIKHNRNGVIGYQITSEVADINKIYSMRKKAVGLLGNTKGARKPIAFTEDTAVPPEHLADFIMEFRALLDGYDLEYGMFGHVDAGVLHVRPALDMCDPKQEQLVNIISKDVVKLVAKYGGLMWGEHGKGYRSEFAPAFFGENLYAELQKLKKAFDPHNKMNPGKICTPYETQHNLVKVADTKRATFDRQIPVAYKEEFEPAMSCNGNGLCFNYDTTSPMCPSSKITQDRRHSPKGRAGLIREWLLQLAKNDINHDTLNAQTFSSNIITRVWRRLFKTPDFNHEVFEAMNGCLACKSCTNQCPVSVDVPNFRAKFMSIYYTRYMRPMKDYFVANIEFLAPIMSHIPRVMNAIITAKPSAWFLEQFIGYVDTPTLSIPSLANRIESYTMCLKSSNDLERLHAIPLNERSNYVMIVQDPFTSYYDADVVEKFAKCIEKLGKTPILLPFSPNGKPQHVKGFLLKFTKTANKTASFLSELAKLNIPMVGVDASLVLCYRDEYQKVLPASKLNFTVQTVVEWLQSNSTMLFGKVTPQKSNEVQYKLLAHCSEKTALPETEKFWQDTFAKLGLLLNIESVGCCGMAGTYGHELEHFNNSKGIYELSWLQHTKTDTRFEAKQQEGAKGIEILATGYSCRSQVKRFANFRPKHPIEILAEIL